MRPVVFGLFLCFLASTQAFSDTSSQGNSLKGIRETSLVIEELPEEVEAEISGDILQTKMEVKLRQAGLKLSEEADSFLYVTLSGDYLFECDGFAYSVRVAFKQQVSLQHSQGFCVAATWDHGRTGYAPVDEFRSTTYQVLDGLLDSFLNDWLAVTQE